METCAEKADPGQDAARTVEVAWTTPAGCAPSAAGRAVASVR